MERLIYLLWKDNAAEGDFVTHVLNEVGDKLINAGASNVEVHARDLPKEAGPGVKGRPAVLEPFDCMVSFWVRSHFHAALFEEILSSFKPSFMAGYLVSSGSPLPGSKQEPDKNETKIVRWPGYCQVALLRKLDSIPLKEWYDIWLNSHTFVAMDTQSVFRYVQNVVVRRLTPDAPPLAGIVEESFPEYVLQNPFRLFDVDGSNEKHKMKDNAAKMQTSVSRFLNPQQVDTVSTSHYVIPEKKSKL